MFTAPQPTLRELDDRDIRAVLARNNVGRLAFAGSHGVDIRPIHYVFSQGAIYGRTAGVTGIACDLAAGAVAFEVDEVEAMTRWRSIVVHGTLATLTTGGAPEEWQRGMAAMQRLMRFAFTDHDPFPDRTVIFRIAPQRITGRAMEVRTMHAPRVRTAGIL